MKRLPLILITLALLASAGCGYVGNPLPPALNVPKPIADVKASQIGDRIYVEFTPPTETTESLTIKALSGMEVRIGKGPSPFTAEAWSQTAKPVELKGSTTPGAIKVEIPAAGWAGQDVVIGARSTSWKGKTSAWSNFINLKVATPPQPPASLKAESDAKGARLSWSGNTPTYRIFRRLPDDKEGVQIGEITSPTFLDETAEYDKKYVYWVIGVDGAARSKESELLEFTPEDHFPPATPTGLTAIIGPASVELAWESNTEADLRGYRVYRSTAGGELQRYADLVEVPAFSDKKPEAGKIHNYVITAVDKHGNESQRSTPVSVNVP